MVILEVGPQYNNYNGVLTDFRMLKNLPSYSTVPECSRIFHRLLIRKFLEVSLVSSCGHTYNGPHPPTNKMHV